MTKIAAAFLLLSGISSLTYQVVWVRLLGLSMGSTSASISTVLAAFFLGLALGSYLAERLTRNRIDNLTVYLTLEVIIGLAGLALLPILLNLDSLLASLPEMGSSLSMKFLVAVSLLSIPTVCMGATFPVMASILIRREGEVGLRVSQLYSLNTAGAVLGAALSGFFFVPNWGLDGAIYIAFGINILIVLIGLSINNKIQLAPLDEPDEIFTVTEQTVALREEAPLRLRALFVLFATGFVAIAVEVGWTKYLSIFTGTTIYGFAAILTIFLLGITAGSWAIRSHLEKMERPEVWMALGLVLLGALLLFTRAGLTAIPPLYEAINHFPVAPWWRHAVKYLFVFVLLFPPTFVLGALFPLNLKLYCGNLQGVRARIGKAYAVNTIASIFGSIFAGFWIIPEFGTDALLTLTGLAILLFPLLFIPALSTSLSRATVVVGVLIAISLNWVFPHLDYKKLISSVQYDDAARAGKKPKYLFLKEGKAGVISMVTFNGRHVKLQNNGLNESFIDLDDDSNVLLIETLLGLIPYMLHDDPKDAFVVGFGGGITTRALTFTKLESIKVVELEPAVVEAGRAIVDGEIAALTDERVTLVYNDARNTLLLEDKRYDIIAAQPSHPWLARAANVFTKEFFEIVKSRLNEDGIYGQWVNLFNMDATTLRSIMQAFYTVFPQGMTFANMNTGDFLMFGSRKKYVFNYELIKTRMQEPKIKVALNYQGLYGPRDLFWYFALSRDEALVAAADIPANSDMNILSEVRLSMLYGNAKGDENPYDFLKIHYKLSIFPYMDGDIKNKLYDLADYFFAWDKPDLAQKIALQLNDIDELAARGIQYEAMWRAFRYTEAEEYYTKYNEWSDRTHYQRAVALAASGDLKAAYRQVKRVKGAQWKSTIISRLLYEEKKWNKLAAVRTTSNEGIKWQAVGLARSDIVAAGKRLSAIENDIQMELPQIELLVKYYAALHDEKELIKYSKKLTEDLRSEITKLKKFFKEALEEKDTTRCQRILTVLETLMPENSGEIEKLQAKLEKLRKTTEGKLP